MHGAVAELTLADILDLLAGAADVALGPGQPVSQLDHALQTAALVARSHPGDAELAAAALVHDVGHLLPGVGDEAHAGAGADAVRPALGQRVATLVGLHVEAKRDLVTAHPDYDRALAPDSAASLVLQGGILGADRTAAFRAHPHTAAAVALRRADDRAKSAGARVEGLGQWVPLLRKLSDGGGRAGA